jgi:hypothetical protein
MAILFTAYWRILGLPLSRLKGLVVDRMPFSLVEVVLWAGLLCAFALLAFRGAGRWTWLKRRRPWLALLTAGPVVLVCMSLGQGAFPWSLAPTAWRVPLAKAFPAPPLAYADFLSEIRLRENRLSADFWPAYYQSLSETEILHGCDRALDGVLAGLGLLPGRTVQKVKAMGPLTTLLGLSYGGPAFHDPFFGELAMVRPQDHPAPRYWRLLAVCHEAAHAKGFTREMDAEILTQLALSSSPDLRYRMLGDIMFLRKSGEKIHFPAYLKQEILQARDSLRQVESRQWAVKFCKRLAEKAGFQNSGKKYGMRGSAEEWDPRHPFYATVASLLSRRDGTGPP